MVFSNLFETDLSRNEEGVFESQFIDITLQSKDIILGTVYRSPSGYFPSFFPILNELLDLLEGCLCELVIVGNFNLNLTDMMFSITGNFLSTMLAARILPTTSIPIRLTEASPSLLDKDGLTQ